jgi:hypothetical protein
MYPHKITTTPTLRFASRPSRYLRLNSSSASSASPALFACAALKSGLPISQNSRAKTGANPAQTEPRFQSNNLQRLKTESKTDQKRTEPEPKVDFFLQEPQFTLSIFTQFQKTPESTEPPARFPHNSLQSRLTVSPKIGFHFALQIWHLDFLRSFIIPRPSGVPSCCGGARCLLIPRMSRPRSPQTQPPVCVK